MCKLYFDVSTSPISPLCPLKGYPACFEYVNRCGMIMCIQPSLTRQTFRGLLGGNCTIVSVIIHLECPIVDVIYNWTIMCGCSANCNSVKSLECA